MFTPHTASGSEPMRGRGNLFDPPAGSLRRTASRGAMMVAVAQGVKLITQIVSVTVLSRLLSPEDFGILAMTTPVLALVGLFQNLGLSQAMVQKENITASEVSGLFWLNATLTLTVALVLCASGPLVAAFYGEPVVGPLVSAMAIPTGLLGLSNQHSAVLTRRMAFGVIAFIESTSALLGLAMAICWGMLAPSVWALYGGLLASSIATAALTWTWTGWYPGTPKRVSGLGRLVNFGAGLTGFGFANFISRNLDNILIGRVLGGTALGFYDRAYKLLLFPLQQIVWPLQRVMVPVLSRVVAEPERYRHAYLRVVCLMVMVTSPAVATAAMLSNRIVPLLLGNAWVATAPIFHALAFAGLVQLLNSSSGWLFISQGRSGEFMRWGIFNAFASAASFLVGLPYGVVGVATAYAASECLQTPFLWLYLGRKGPVGAGHVWRAVQPMVCGIALILIVIWLLEPLFPREPTLAIGFAMVVAYATMAGTVCCFRSGRLLLQEAVSLTSFLPLRENRLAWRARGSSSLD